jgi:DNA-binding MarR family transcriptional regulator
MLLGVKRKIAEDIAMDGSIGTRHLEDLEKKKKELIA